jgi:hypothetical protein
MNSIPAGLRRQVVFRAGGFCEYCGLSQESQEAAKKRRSDRSRETQRITLDGSLIYKTSTAT